MADEERMTADVGRPLHVSWHEILPLIDGIEQRLTAIEERLGISSEQEPSDDG
jgi:hypothetical protein